MSQHDVLAKVLELLALGPQQRAQELARVADTDPEFHALLLSWPDSPATTSSHSLLRAVDGAIMSQAQPAPIHFVPGEIVDGYRLIRELARGGMSVVWVAERADGIVQRQIALKMPDVLISEVHQRERLARERDVLAALAHPHIARLYDAGVTQSGQPYLALELIADGMPITAYCDQRGLSVRQRLQVFLQVLSAVEYAHAHMIVHRDLKPSNILVNALGEVKLLDFGIAKLLTAPHSSSGVSDLTQTGGFVMTPRYAAPEQLSGKSISTATDIYVLGLVLHELLTGRLPRASDMHSPLSVARAVAAVVDDEPGRASRSPIDETAAAARGGSVPKLRAEITGDLDRILAKALRPRPEDRYPSVERYADDIRRFLAYLPVAATPPSFLHSARLFLRRNSGVSIAAGVGLATVLAVGGVAFGQFQESRANELRAQAVRDFIFGLLNDAEPDENQPEGEVTGKQMVDAAVRRAQREFASTPRLQGELLAELGRMYTRLGESDTATSVMSGALTLLQAHAPRDDPALNKTRAHLADAALAASDVNGARALALAAQQDCTRPGAECSKAVAYASTVLSRIAAREGRNDDALMLMQRSVAATVAGFGPRDAETALAYTNHAILARNAGRIQEAGNEMKQAAMIADSLVLRAADRIIIERTSAILDIDLGHYPAARERLSTLMNRTKDRKERGIQQRLIATALLLQGEGPSALATVESAIEDSSAAKDQPEVLRQQVLRARALSLVGRHRDALAAINDVLATLKGRAERGTTLVALRARRAHGEILARSGAMKAARDELEPLVAESADLEQTLELLGCVLRELGQVPEALALHQRARALFEKELPPDHPFLLRNTLYKEAALVLMAPTPATRARFSERAAQFSRQFASTSSWKKLIETCTRQPDCRLLL